MGKGTGVSPPNLGDYAGQNPLPAVQPQSQTVVIRDALQIVAVPTLEMVQLVLSVVALNFPALQPPQHGNHLRRPVTHSSSPLPSLPSPFSRSPSDSGARYASPILGESSAA
jgi:hypothetical protein